MSDHPHKETGSGRTSPCAARIRAIESLEEYRALSYYERWVAATEKLLVEKGVLTSDEIDERATEIRRRWDGP